MALAAHGLASQETQPMPAVTHRSTMDTLLQADLPLAERAYRHIRLAILRCEFAPEQRLRVETLSKQFEISSSPVREALSRLSEQGFVRSIDNKGFRVAPLTIAGIADLTRVRLLIECEALRDSISHGDDAWEARIVSAAHSLARIEQRLGDQAVILDDEWSQRHRDFHQATYANCASPLLDAMVMELFDRADRYRRYSARHRQAQRRKHSEHQVLMKSILERNVDNSIALLREHIQATERNVTQALQKMAAGKPAH
ncbi:GntR family transcriptional regulator [Candidimonas nitroreducens]|nr:FCD domain-containing protein [Candidimonas nitroreducens]